jgi:hypothetical protein
MTREMKKLLLAFAVLAVAPAVAAQESLTAAKDLYASAAYEDALSTLTRLRDGSAATAEPIITQIDQYRTFCLFALGRTAEAESVAESLIRKDPLLQLDNGDASPRIVAMFADVRRRLLPGLTRDEYRAARASLDRKDFAGAELQLTRTSRLLEESQKLGTLDETLSDLRVLVDGFLVLTRATVDARTASQRPEAHAVPPASIGPSPVASAATGPSQTGAPPATSTTGGREAPKSPAPQPQPIYDSATVDVVAPVTIRQPMPLITPSVASVLSAIHKNGILEIVIDEEGNVERAVMLDRVNPIFDALVLDVTRTWKYRPAMKGSVAVRYVKTIAIVTQ